MTSIVIGHRNPLAFTAYPNANPVGALHATVVPPDCPFYHAVVASVDSLRAKSQISIAINCTVCNNDITLHK